MSTFRSVTSPIIPLPLKDVDTDMIIPAQFLTSISREGYGAHLFKRLRDQDPGFPLNLPEHRASKILVADHNFGCGSSREHAVWALRDWGIEVVIAKSFADIFSSNAPKNGLVLVTLPAEEIDSLLSRPSPPTVTVSLEATSVTLPDGRTIQFPFDPFRRHCLLNGLDDLEYLLRHRDEIDRWSDHRSTHRYFTSLEPNHELTSAE